jgi:hypothetical protein
MASHSGVSPSSSSRRIAPKAITLARWDLMTLAEGDLVAWDAESFTIDWTANADTTPYPVHYAIVGGNAVTAKVVSWQTPTAAGVKAVTGVGFQPDVVFHFHAGWFFTTTPPATITSAGFGLGMMDRAGGQCATHVRATDAKNPTLTARAQRTDASLYITHEVGPIVTKQAAFVSMDADGFTGLFDVELVCEPDFLARSRRRARESRRVREDDRRCSRRAADHRRGDEAGARVPLERAGRRRERHHRRPNALWARRG